MAHCPCLAGEGDGMLESDEEPHRGTSARSC